MKRMSVEYPIMALQLWVKIINLITALPKKITPLVVLLYLKAVTVNIGHEHVSSLTLIGSLTSRIYRFFFLLLSCTDLALFINKEINIIMKDSSNFSQGVPILKRCYVLWAYLKV